MKLIDGLTVVVGNKKYKGEIPDDVFKKSGLKLPSNSDEKKKQEESKK